MHQLFTLNKYGLKLNAKFIIYFQSTCTPNSMIYTLILIVSQQKCVFAMNMIIFILITLVLFENCQLTYCQITDCQCTLCQLPTAKLLTAFSFYCTAFELIHHLEPKLYNSILSKMLF